MVVLMVIVVFMLLLEQIILVVNESVSKLLLLHLKLLLQALVGHFAAPGTAGVQIKEIEA